jgi:hypothetical protein
MTDEEFKQMLAQNYAEPTRIRNLANPAAVPYSDFQVPTSNVAPSSFASNLGGLLFGGADSGLNEYLSREQQKQMQSQALMSAAMSLLRSGRTTTTPIGLGEALGSAYEAGTAGYQGAQKNAIEQMLTKQKLDEARREANLQKFFMDRLSGAAPSAAVTPSLPVSGQPLTAMQAAALPTPVYGVGPTPQRAAMIGQTLPNESGTISPVTVTARQRPDIFSSLTPDQLMIAALSPKAALPRLFEESLKTESFETITGQNAADLGLDPRGKYQINNRTGQISTVEAPSDEFKIVSGVDAVKLGLPGVGSYQYNTKTKQATPLGTAEGPFGGGTTGAAYNILLTEDPSSAKYALAYRELSKPVPTEQVQPDGSTRIVYTQPAPIPPSFAKPSYKGKIATPTTAPATIVQPSAVSAPAPAKSAVAPAVAAPADGAVAIPLPAGVKSTPLAPRPEEITASRSAIKAAVDFVAALEKIENVVSQEGMQLGGIGSKGATQTAIYEDLLTKARKAAELGVLNKEDLPRLQAQLSDPTNLSTYIKGLGGPSYFFAQTGEMKDRMIQEAMRTNLQFGFPIMQLPQSFTKKPPPPIPTTTAIKPPPIIQQILELYPSRKQ